MQGLEKLPTSLEDLEGELLQLPQIDCQITHNFGPGVYIREGAIPAGTLIMGHAHRTSHLNVILRGKVAVVMDGEVQIIDGPAMFTAHAGRKVIYAIEDTVMQNVHATSETDIDALEEQLVDKSDVWCAHEALATTDLLLEAVGEAG
tara:strand:+ start:1910 stop:2350 length:441 start_codon:yes stop_codon:yes gene_type:complete